MDPRLDAQIAREERGDLMGSIALCGLICLLAYLGA